MSKSHSSSFTEGSLIKEKWRIERLLGEGGSARSWLVTDEDVDRKRVLKEYKEHVDPEKAKKEFYAVEDHLKQHQRCPRVLYFSLDPLFIVTDYVEGESLETVARSNVTAEEYRSYVIDVLEVLEYMHGKGLNHNDITPRNIIIDTEDRAWLIDFGLARTTEAVTQTIALTPRYAAPEALSGERGIATDMYSVGTSFLFSMLRHSPFEQTELGDDKYKLIPLSEDDESRLGALGIAIAEQLFQLIDPDPSKRPQSAVEFSELLRCVAAIEIEEGTPNTNPTVDDLRQLYRGSRLGNAGNRGLEGKFAESTYVDTLLDSDLTRKVIRGDFDLVILTGNPGDGKTSYLKKLRGYLEDDSGAQVLVDDLGGWTCETPSRTFTALYDASEARDGFSSTDRIHKALTATNENTPHTALLAINDGRVRQFFVNDFADRYPHFSRAVSLGLSGSTPDKSDRVAYIDLKRRSLAPTPSDKDGLAGRALDLFTEDSRWKECKTCSAREVCPMLRNRNQLRGPGRDKLLTLVAISHLRRQRRATFRDFRSAAGWIITGDRGCGDVHRDIERDIDPRRRDDSLHFDLAFNRGSTDNLISEWSNLDPVFLPAAALERDAHISLAREDWHRDESLNRRAFFADLDVDSDSVAQINPYRYLAEFQGALASDGKVSEVLPRILLGLSRLLGAFGYEGENLALQDGQNDGWAVLRELDCNDFKLVTRPEPSPFVEQQADELLLIHSRARLVLNLDSVELILRAADGELINDAAASAIKLELELFAEKLALHPAAAAIIVNPSGVQYSVAESEGLITLGASL